MAPITHDFIDALHRLEESGNVDVIASLFTDNAELSNPLVLHGSDEENGAKAFWASYRAALGDASSEFVNVIEDEGKAVLEWRTTAAIDGESISYGGVSVIETDGEKISAFRAYFDPRQLTTRIAGQDNTNDKSGSGHDVTDASTDAQRDAAEARAAGGYS